MITRFFFGPDAANIACAADPETPPPDPGI